MLSEDEIISDSYKHKIYTGVYFLISGNSIVYVGSSFKISKRLMTHYSGGVKFDRWTFVEVKTKRVLRLRAIEAEYILNLKPRYNMTIPGNDKFISLNSELPTELKSINLEFKVSLLKENGFDLIEYKVDEIGAKYYYDCRIKNRIRIFLLRNFSILEEAQLKYNDLRKQINSIGL